MTEVNGGADGGEGQGPERGSETLVCPRCRARYRPRRATHGRRVRCRHCDHVWRDEPGTATAVAGALDVAAGNWLRLGSTLLARMDHASTLAHAVTDIGGPPRPQASEWIDRSIGRYVIKTVLGEGAMGHVFEAYDRDLKRTVALKMLAIRVEGEHEPIGVKMFMQEARIAAKLQHPNAVTIHEIGEDKGVYYFAMERIHGVTLAALIDERGPLPASECCYVVATAARALAAGHAIGAVHRDVKPSNIMIDRSGFVKVTDFGLADVAGIDGVPELSSRPVGTPGWMSPEAARGEKTTPMSDIYSLGLVMHAVLTGERLITAASRSGLVRCHQAASSVRRESLPEDWPPRVRDIVVQCLQADPRDRYQSADTLAADLLRALVPSDEDATLVLAEPQHRSVDSVPSYLSWIVLGLLLMVSGLLAFWWWFLRD